MTPNIPLVSVIIPTYNGAKHILKTLDSVRNQTMSSWELNIVIDGSQDDTFAVLEQDNCFKDPRIRIFQTINKGVSAARNFGIEQSNGKFLAFLDHDDIWHNRKLELQSEFLIANPDIDACLTWFLIAKLSNQALGYSSLLVNHKDFNSLMKGWLSFKQFGGLVSSSLVFRRSENALRFDENISSNADLEFILRYSQQKRIEIIPTPTVIYSNSTAGMHFQPSSMTEFIRVSHTFPVESFQVSRSRMIAAAYAHKTLFLLHKKNFHEVLAPLVSLWRMKKIHFLLITPYFIARKRLLSWLQFLNQRNKIRKLWN